MNKKLTVPLGGSNLLLFYFLRASPCAVLYAHFVAYKT